MRLGEIVTEGYDTLLLDRDGTLNVHIIGGYVTKWSEFEFIPGVIDALAEFSKHFKRIFIVTNQRGVGKESLRESDLSDIHKRMTEVVTQSGGRVDGIYCCTSLTEEDIRRKPGRGMFDDILRDHPEVNPATTLMVGDGDVDAEFAKNCGIAFQRVDSLKRDGDKLYWVNA